ncbi:LuxR C-terminal-related transcriptional regulator [Paractinoplanes brasiliensis]|uniref:LuxR family maltose regulon positive regulatory protein n=1 Tax=Paractinoplanes brasiliensis TaxID=52695 RepID=A0A4R6J7P3_9ACTN|nr:LuxR C-terminal-related transcriptional regulator [Actinoplanes brasiliensis]TDO31472.1 LuxR family maltose regulon positive regulatory protein [Actinoplanes brasiliensis]GID30867.1 LuxR family transcriptional regulator [Actinoplanes brasiliensis]
MSEVADSEVYVRTVSAERARSRLPAGLIWRPRLIEALDAGVRNTLTLVCAGAGWGKSSLVASWSGARSVSGPIAWLTVNDEHNDPGVFWTDLGSALSAAGVVLRGSGPPAAGYSIPRRILETLSVLPVTLVVVLDDVHRLTDRRVLGGLGRLVRPAPERVRFVMAGRREPGMSLHQLRVTGALSEIRAADLGFRVEEAAELLAVRHRRVPPADLAALVRHVEGWPVGVRLAVDAQDGLFPDQAAEDYLLEEVLADQPADVQRFLLRTGLPDRVCGGLADALTGQQNGQRTLERLAQDHLFVEPVGTGGWFRYHRTFRSALRNRLLASCSSTVPGLHLVAARWHATRGDVLPALSHAAAAGDWQLVGRLAVDRGLPLFSSGDRRDLVQVLLRIPDARLADTPELMICAAMRDYLRGDLAGTATRLARARELLGPTRCEQPAITGVALSIVESAVSIRWDGDMPRLLDVSTRLLSDLATMDVTRGAALPQYRSMVLNDKAVALLWTGQLDHADRYLWAACSATRAAGMPLVTASVLGHLALLDLVRGSLRDADRNASEALDIARRIDAEKRPAIAPASLVRALIESERGRDIEAGDALRQALHAGGEVPEAALAALAALVRARLLVDRGEALGARMVVRQAWADAPPGLVAPLLMSLTGLVESEIDLALGDAGAVLARYGGDRLLLPAELVCRARAALAVGRPAEAEALISRVHTGTDRVSAVTAGVLGALAADARGRTVAAGEALQRALRLAEPDRIRRPFRLCDPQRMQRLAGRQQWLTELRASATDGILGDITHEVPVVAPSAGPLSERELEVLQHLPTMLTAAEIAEGLGISVNTVKAHMRSIYRKLGAGRRREAVVTARQLGLI